MWPNQGSKEKMLTFSANAFLHKISLSLDIYLNLTLSPALARETWLWACALSSVSIICGKFKYCPLWLCCLPRCESLVLQLLPSHWPSYPCPQGLAMHSGPSYAKCWARTRAGWMLPVNWECGQQQQQQQHHSAHRLKVDLNMGPWKIWDSAQYVFLSAVMYFKQLTSISCTLISRKIGQFHNPFKYIRCVTKYISKAVTYRESRACCGIPNTPHFDLTH